MPDVFEIEVEQEVEKGAEPDSSLDASKIFHGYRSLGFVCNQIPLVSRYMERRKECFLTTAIGATTHTYAVGSSLFAFSLLFYDLVSEG